MREARHKARSSEDGFSFVKLFVIIIVIGILASVTVLVYDQKKSSWRSSVQNDVHNTQVIISTVMGKTSGKLTMKSNDPSQKCDESVCTFTQAGGVIGDSVITVSSGNTIKVEVEYFSSGNDTIYTVYGSNKHLDGFDYTYKSVTGVLAWHPHKP